MDKLLKLNEEIYKCKSWKRRNDLIKYRKRLEVQHFKSLDKEVKHETKRKEIDYSKS